MPDEHGMMTPEEVKKASDWLNGITAGRQQLCPVCNEPGWTIAGSIVQPLTLGVGAQPNFALGGYPFVMAVSVKCGYTRLFNAVVMGIVAGVEQSKQE